MMIATILLSICIYATSSVGNPCISSCTGLADGDYQSCKGCQVYASCSNQQITDPRACAIGNTYWDDNKKYCDYISDTCTQTPPTAKPSVSPTNVPSKNPSTSPSANPSKSPSTNPTKSPSTNPSASPSANPSVSPTVPQCADWIQTNSPSVSPVVGGGGNGNIPIPDVTQPPQLCQIGKSGEWNSLDRWYSWDCSCYDGITLFKLNQFIHGWFYEMQISFNEQIEGRFESYFENYATEDIFMKTSLSDQPQMSGPQWNDLSSITSCDPANPGYAELTRAVSETMQYQISPGGIFIRECTENGHEISAQLKIDNYRIRDGITENQVAFGDFIIKREQGSNVWLIKEIIFTGQTVGFLPQTEP